ncbi:MAG TPA: hypothetical protein VEB86_15540 [Chryseosolibacter sp.]|nr:hypothetical protein [Chryseosolibacter sp.]
MTIFSILIFSLFLQEIPYKAAEDFEIKLEYQFKQRPPAETTTVIRYDESQKERDRRMSTAMLPYLMIRVNLLKVPVEEVRVKAIDNLNHALLNKKIKGGDSFLLDLGFTDDVKDRVAPHEYNLYFLSPDKAQLSRIHLFVEEDGTFLVNGEKRGKF